MVSVAISLAILCLVGKPVEIPADHRPAFEEWTVQTVGTMLADMARADEARAALEAQSIDWLSFLIEGERNHSFPKMLFITEFRDRPLDAVRPSQWTRRLTHRQSPPPHVSIPHSSFFTNTDIESYTPEAIAREVASVTPKPPMKITKVKQGGTSEGIWIKDASGRKFIMVEDPPFAPEMTTSAEFIGSNLVRILGWNVPRTSISVVEGTGDAGHDGRRVVATLALDHFKGGWRYGSFRDRREVRALRLVAAWINNVDQTEQNTGLVVNDEGVSRHYVLDFGASLGSFTFRPQIPRLGWTRLFDPVAQGLQPLYDHKLLPAPWQAPYQVQSASVGYFSPHFDPDRWQPFYTNMGFADTDENDCRWAAARIARITDEQIEAIVGLAAYSHDDDARYVARILIERRDLIIRRYGIAPSPNAVRR